MIKIFNASQIKKIDNESVDRQGITSIELMERAAAGVCEKLFHLLTPEERIYVFAGAGNNGGDALAIARILQAKAFKPKVFLVQGSNQLSPDCNENKKRYEAINEIQLIRKSSDIPQLSAGSIIIDGLFGSGLNRPLDDIYKEVVQAVNRSGSTVYSIDIPSGMYIEDNSNNDNDAIIRSEQVFSFQFPKLSLLLPESAGFYKQFSIVDIGLSEDSIQEEKTDYYLIEKQDVASILKPREKFSHKGDYGRAYIVAGSGGKMGAAVMAARACLRSGVGLLTMHLPQKGVGIMQTSVPEAMVDEDICDSHSTQIDFDLHKHIIGIGPGIGISNGTASMLQNLFRQYREPVVIDADALNIISENDDLKNQIPPNSILTPHPLEFDRLTREQPANGYQRLQLARGFARKHTVYIVLKGAYSAVITPEGQVYFNPTGNPGMATGGSGDVLTGILTSLSAQGYSPLDTCLLGVYLHGLSGDIAAKQKTEYSMLPSDIIDCISMAFSELSNNQTD